MNQNHLDKSLSERQQHKTADSKVSYLCCELPAAQTELPTEESLSTEDLAQLVGGTFEESPHLSDQAVLHPSSNGGADPFEPSPTYPSPPDIDLSVSH